MTWCLYAGTVYVGAVLIVNKETIMRDLPRLCSAPEDIGPTRVALICLLAAGRTSSREFFPSLLYAALSFPYRNRALDVL
jgi:hypothetical protein